MDSCYYVIEQYWDNIEVVAYPGNKWGDVYARIQELKKENCKCNGFKLIVLRGMEIERFEVKNEK